MKKIIIPAAVILVLMSSMLLDAGLKLNSISNSLAETENAIKELKHRAETNSAKEVNVEADTMSFTEDSLKLVEYVRENEDTGHVPLWYILQNQVRLPSEHMLDGFIPVTWHKNGFPKICVNYWFKKDKNNNEENLARTGHVYVFLDDSGHVIATGEGKKHIRWWCETNGNKGAPSISFSNPNRCKNFYAIRNSQ